MPTQNDTTKSGQKSPSKRELQNEVRRLRLELQGYRVFGTPLEIAIKIGYTPPVCFWCNFQIEDRTKCTILSHGAEQYWFHHECFDDGIQLLADINHDETGSLNGLSTIRKLRENAMRYDS